MRLLTLLLIPLLFLSSCIDKVPSLEDSPREWITRNLPKDQRLQYGGRRGIWNVHLESTIFQGNDKFLIYSWEGSASVAEDVGESFFEFFVVIKNATIIYYEEWRGHGLWQKAINKSFKCLSLKDAINWEVLEFVNRNFCIQKEPIPNLQW